MHTSPPDERFLLDIQPLFLYINLQSEMCCIVHTEMEVSIASQQKELLEVFEEAKTIPEMTARSIRASSLDTHHAINNTTKASVVASCCL